jgi:hypothetical protein
MGRGKQYCNFHALVHDEAHDGNEQETQGHNDATDLAVQVAVLVVVQCSQVETGAAQEQVVAELNRNRMPRNRKQEE